MRLEVVVQLLVLAPVQWSRCVENGWKCSFLSENRNLFSNLVLAVSILVNTINDLRHSDKAVPVTYESC